MQSCAGSMRPTVKMTGPQHIAAKLQPAVVSPRRLTCYAASRQTPKAIARPRTTTPPPHSLTVNGRRVFLPGHRGHRSPMVCFASETDLANSNAAKPTNTRAMPRPRSGPAKNIDSNAESANPPMTAQKMTMSDRLALRCGITLALSGTQQAPRSVNLMLRVRDEQPVKSLLQLHIVLLRW
jgi:hypothetical protein